MTVVLLDELQFSLDKAGFSSCFVQIAAIVMSDVLLYGNFTSTT